MNEGVGVISRGCDQVLERSSSPSPTSAVESVAPTTTTTTTTTPAENEIEIKENVTLSNVKAINKMDNCRNDIEDSLIEVENISDVTIEETIVKKNTTRSVSFPSNDNELVTGYLEPANPWEYAHNVKVDDVISLYKKSCDHHNTEPLKNVIEQLEKMEITHVRVSELCLKNEILDKNHCEPLEELLKRLQFCKIDLEAASLDDESAETLFDMFEYYESARHVNISKNCNIGARGWQSCARMLKNTHCLEQLDAKDIVLTQQHLNILKRPLQLGSHLQILKLENCNIAGRAFAILISALKLNTGLKELYLADNHLEKQDGTQLGSLLKINHHLQLLDVSNNNLQDAGAHDIIAGMIVQSNDTPSGKGLSILIMWNNHLTKELSGHFAQLLAQSKSLETLNIGKNAMSDEFLEICIDSLKTNKYLLQLGLQSTGLVLKSIMALAEIIELNSTLQRIDLRDNNIQLTPLTFLSLALKKNMTITQIDLDNTAGSKSQPLIEQYGELVGEIRGYCARNEEPQSTDSSTYDSTSSPQQRSRLSSCSSRKISLTCQTLPRSPPTMATTASGVTANELYGRTTLISESKRTSGGRLRSPAPSPIPSPVASPIPSPSRNRFVVSRVSEQTLNNSNNSSTSSSPITTPSSLSPTCFFPSTNGVVNSRFRVTIVEPPTQTPTPTSSLSSLSSPSSSSSSSSSASLLHQSTSIPVSLPVKNVVTTSCPNKNITVGFNCNVECTTQTNDNSELNLNKLLSSDGESKLDSVKLISDEIKQPPPPSQQHTSSLEKLLGLFQHPGNLFTSAFVDKTENKNPLHSSMSSLMGLGDKFQQYLRDGRVEMNKENKHRRLTSSESQLYNSIDDNKKCELINNKILINIDNDGDDDNCKLINNDSDINLPVNCLTNNSYVPELLVDDNNSLSIDEANGIIVDNNDETINNTLNNHVNEICDSSSTNCSINLPNSLNNYSHCNIISDINNVNIVNNSVDNVNSEILICDSENVHNNDDSVIKNENLLDIKCDVDEQQLNLLENNYLMGGENNENETINNNEINCGTFDDDINNILTSILDMIPYETLSDCAQNDKQTSQYIESEAKVNCDVNKTLVDNDNVDNDTVMCNDNEQMNKRVNEDDANGEIVQINKRILNESICNMELSSETIIDKQTDTAIDENHYSYSWINIKSSTLTISNDNSCSNPIDNSDLIITTAATTTTAKTVKSHDNPEEISQLNGSIVNSITNDNNYGDKLLENNYLDSGDVFTDEIIFNIADISLRDGPISSDASIMFEHNSETSSNIDTLSENPSSSRDSFQESIDSGIDDLLLKDKRNVEAKMMVNIPIISDNEYLMNDATIEKLMIGEKIDENKLSTDIVQIHGDNTNSSNNDIVNSTGLK